MTGCCVASVLLAGILLSAPRPAPAEPDEPNPYQSLIDNSPFLTPAFKAKLGQRDGTALSFAGYTRIEDEWLFGLLDRKSGAGYWLKLNEERNGIRIERFEEEKEKIHLTVSGIGFDLKLDRRR
jgi:hypothetical protein